MLAQYTCAIRAVTGAGLAPQVKKVSPGVWTVVTQLPLKLQPPPVAFLLPAQVAVQVVVAPQLLEMCSHPIATLPVPTSRAAAGEVVPIPTCPNRQTIFKPDSSELEASGILTFSCNISMLAIKGAPPIPILSRLWRQK